MGCKTCRVGTPPQGMPQDTMFTLCHSMRVQQGTVRYSAPCTGVYRLGQQGTVDTVDTVGGSDQRYRRYTYSSLQLNTVRYSSFEVVYLDVS